MFVAFPLHARAQIKISNSVFGSGGGVASDSSFRLIGTLGQPATGASGDNANSVRGGFWFQSGGIVTGVEEIETPEIPKVYRLDQNYPNPFNPTTTIVFALPKESLVTIKLFDLHGREVAILADEEMEPGEYKVVFDAQGFASGVYFYRIQAANDGSSTFVKTMKMLLLK